MNTDDQTLVDDAMDFKGLTPRRVVPVPLL